MGFNSGFKGLIYRTEQ